MALEVRALDARLQIQLDMGVDEKGKKITRSKTFGKVRSDLLDQDLFNLANTLVGLQSHAAVAIRKIGQSEYANV